MRLMAAIGLAFTFLSACSGCGAGGLPESPGAQAGSGGEMTSGQEFQNGAGKPESRAPAFRFQPQNHPPHEYPVTSVGDLSLLPQMVVRSCRGFEKPHLRKPWSQKKRRSTGWGAYRTKSKRSAGLDAAGAALGSSGASGPPRSSEAPELRNIPRPRQGARPTTSHHGPVQASESESPPVSDDGAREDKTWNSGDPESPTSPAIAEQRDRYHGWGSKIYLSNDDTMSLSSAQRILYAIDHYRPLPAAHIRPHELLNYFSFDAEPVGPGRDFSVLPQLQEKPGEPGAYTLGFSVSGRSLSREQRRNAALTFVVDRSGSMAAEGRMSYLKRGLRRMMSELKRGDTVNLVTFDHRVCTPIENYVVGRDSQAALERAVERLLPSGSTNLELGLRQGYALADKSYQSTHSNRVVLITDALTNTGVTDSQLISLISEKYDTRRVRLSGVGVGSEFNDQLLDRLTEKGKGAYVFLGSDAEVDAVFGRRFVSLIETVANDVHLRLHLPPSLRMNVFYGEESSTSKSDVQAIHYFSGTNQMFLSDVIAKGGQLRPEDSVMLSVEYHHPETNQPAVEEYAFVLADVLGATNNVQKGRLLISFVDGLSDIARSKAGRSLARRGGWRDDYASEQCSKGRHSLAEQASRLPGDPEVRRVVELWERFCSRYSGYLAVSPAPLPPKELRAERASHQRRPLRRKQPSGDDVWPGARH